MINLMAMHIQRFFSYLSAFAGFMLILVTGGNYFVLFVGWEGIGIVSYLLISYFFTRIQATKAAILALTMNRLGDMGLSIGFFALFALLGTIDYSIVFSVAPYLNENAITIVSLLLFSGAMAKSAQVPLSTWLPGSMEAQQIKVYKLIKILIILFFYLCVLIIFSDLFLDSSFFKFHNLFNISITILNNRDDKGRFINSPPRDKQGRFISVKDDKTVIPVTPIVLECLVGSLLGDGSLRVNKKDKKGQIKPNTNCIMLLLLKTKNILTIYEIYLNLYVLILNLLRSIPWPNPDKGLPVLQYNFSSKSLPVLTEMFQIWYRL